MSQETYVPTGDELKKAEEMMTPGEAVLSKDRFASMEALDTLFQTQGNHFHWRVAREGKSVELRGELVTKEGTPLEVVLLADRSVDPRYQAHVENYRGTFDGKPLSTAEAGKLFLLVIEKSQDAAKEWNRIQDEALSGISN